MINRRKFITNAAIGTLAALNIPQIAAAAISEEKVTKLSLAKGNTILFQGDSITDASRLRDEKSFNNSKALGSGYALLAAADILERHPDKNLKIFNRGISGNKVFQLANRWDADCLDIKPDVLSILIGVNDFWHTLSGTYKGTIAIYRNDFKALLDKTRNALPDVKLVIGEPFAIPGVKAVDEKWYPAFDEYRAAAREIAKTYQAVFIPYQAVFNKAIKQAPASYWTHDGVHPSVAGAKLMAHAWVEAVKG